MGRVRREGREGRSYGHNMVSRLVILRRHLITVRMISERNSHPGKEKKNKKHIAKVKKTTISLLRNAFYSVSEGHHDTTHYTTKSTILQDFTCNYKAYL